MSTNIGKAWNKICLVSFLFLSFTSLFSQEIFDLETAEKDPNYKIQKLKYLDELYDAGPNVDIQELRFKNQENLKELKQKNASKSNVFANGNLTGEWFERGPNNEAGDLQDFDYDPVTDDIYAISVVGHLWKGNLDKRKWTLLNDQIRFNNNFFEHVKLPNGNDRILALYGSGEDAKKVRYSDDQGATWTIASGFDFYDHYGKGIRLFELSDGTLVYLVFTWIENPWGAGYELYHSTDSGATFSKILSIDGKGHSDKQVSLWKYPKSDQLFIYDTKEQQRYVINDLGGSAAITGPQNLTGSTLPEQRFNATGRISGNQQLHYVNANYNMYSSTDGLNWTLLGQGTNNADNSRLSVWGKNRSFLANPNNNQIYGGSFQFYKTTDNDPVNWDEQYSYWWVYYDKNLPNRQDNLHVDITGIKYFEKSNGAPFFIILNHSGVHVSYDNMETTENLGLDGLNITTLYDHATAPDGTIYAGAQDKGTMMNISDNNSGTGIIDTENQTTGDGMRELFFNNGQSYFGFLQNGFMMCKPDKNQNGGYRSWNVPGNHTAGWINPLEAHPDPSAKKAYIAGGNINGDTGSYLIEMEVSFNADGSNFQWLPNQFDYDFRANSRNGTSVIKAISASTADFNRLYVATADGTFFYSTDAGNSWTKSTYNIPTSLLPWDIAVSKTDADTVFLCGRGWSNTGVYQSNDGGVTFEPLSNNIPSAMFFDIVLDTSEEFLYAGTSEGPYAYSFADSSWYYIGDAVTPYVDFRSVEYIEDTDVVRYGTYGRGIWDFKVDNSVLSVDEIPLAESQQFFKLYPNPAQDNVYIDFDNQFGLEKAGVYIYDMQGKKLFEQERSLSSGKNKIDIEVVTLSSGMYNLILKIGNKKITRKVTLK